MSLWFRGPSPIVPEAASAPEGNFQSNCSMCIWPFSRRSLVGACCAIGTCPAEMVNVVATIVPSTALRSNAVARRSSARRTSPERVRARVGRLPARSGAFCSRFVNCAKASPEIDARSAPPRMLKSTLSGPSALQSVSGCWRQVLEDILDTAVEVYRDAFSGSVSSRSPRSGCANRQLP